MTIHTHSMLDYISSVVHRYSCWEPIVTNHIINLSKGGVFIDVGANIGYYSLIASKHYSRIIAFEPIEENYTLIKQSIVDNNIKNIEIVDKCVSDKNIDIELTSFSANMGGTRNIAKTKKHNVEHMIVHSTKSYKTTTLDTYTETLDTIDLLKIDVEGFELNVLNGFLQGLKTKKCKNIILELSPSMIEISECLEILNLLNIHGYTVFDLGLHEKGNINTTYFTTKINPSDFVSFIKTIKQTNILAAL
jgi:FkbM family methyltransferase